MSGDVQPRKRREKKKKKEDVPEEVIFQHQHQTTTYPSVTDDLNIHLQKEASTGGGLCAKLVFFILLTVLTTLIGLIITEHRGLTDLDTIDTESRFSQLFEGWVDKPSLTHESKELSIEQSEEHIHEEEEEQEEEEARDEHDEEDQSVGHDDDESEEQVSEETVTDESATEEENDDEEREESDLQDEDTMENESDEVSNENDDENEDEVEENEDEDEQDLNAQEEDEEEDEQDYASEDEEKYEISDTERDESSLPTKEEMTQENKEESKEDQDEQDDSEEAVDRTETERSKTPAESEEAPDQINSEEAADRAESEEAADQTESAETVDRIESEETAIFDNILKATVKKSDEEDTIVPDAKETTKVHQAKHLEPKKTETVEEVPEDSNEPQQSENYNMVVKFGVGTALLVVAHVVLVQKWRTEKISAKKTQDAGEETETVTPDLSRRNTIVTPPSLQEIEQDIENVDEEYSEEDEDYDSDDSRSKPTRAKMRYQELQSTYSHTLTPDWQPKEARENRNKDYEEEEDEGDEDYDDEISENEDEELLKRLEAKYGRIRQSDEEPDDDADDDENGNEDDEEDEEEEEEAAEEEELEEDRDEDFDSWKRVKVSSDDVPEDTDSENEKDWSKQHSGAQTIYDFTNVTNSNDWKIRKELDQARQNLANDAAYALTLFNKILERNPSSPRALYGKAQALDILAEEKRSNNLLQQAILNYQQVLKVGEVPDALFQIAAERCIDRMRFRGLYAQAVPIHKLLIDKFPEEVKFGNNLAVTYLTMNKINEARKILYKTLLKWPNDGFALVHYGFILKTSDNNLEQAVDLLQKGIATKEPGVMDGRFYFHLGDALTRLGKTKEAMTVYLDGVANKVFLSQYQRSLYNVERLTGKPWWQKEETPHVRFFEDLENNWQTIRDEGLSILNKKGYFQSESENLRDVGDWKQFELYARGIKNSKNCRQCPFTCKIVETLPDATGCRRGQIKFSVMHPGTHVWPHCGPTNCRLRVHLGLKVPSNTYIRVGEEIRSWEEGKVLIFDDSFEHEVWHNGTDTRLVLIVDVWHPELTRKEKLSLSSI